MEYIFEPGQHGGTIGTSVRPDTPMPEGKIFELPPDVVVSNVAERALEKHVEQNLEGGEAIVLELDNLGPKDGEVLKAMVERYERTVIARVREGE